jgi:hypothetical protein
VWQYHGQVINEFKFLIIRIGTIGVLYTVYNYNVQNYIRITVNYVHTGLTNLGYRHVFEKEITRKLRIGILFTLGLLFKDEVTIVVFFRLIKFS